MDLLTRFWRLCRATLSGGLDGVEDPARDLELSLHELQDGYRAAREKVVLALATKKQLECSIRSAGQEADCKRQEAELAVKTRDAATGRRALDECRRLLAVADRDGRALLQVAKEVTELQDALSKMEERLAEADRRRRDLAGQLQTGEAQTAVGTAAEPLSATEPVAESAAPVVSPWRGLPG